MTNRFYKIYNNDVACYVTTRKELQAFAISQKVTSCKFSIVDVKKISDTCNKETEVLVLTGNF